MNPVHDRRFDQVDAEQLIGALTGVVSAHVVTSPGGEIVEIHVLAKPTLHPKQVVRNVESALSAALGIQVDRRVVSVAQIRTEAEAEATTAKEAAVLSLSLADEPADDSPEEPATAAPERLEYVRYEARRDAERCTCKVVLRSRTAEVTGSGDGPDTAGGRAEAAARAVFDAIGQARPDARLELAGAVISSSRGRSFVIVSAHALLDRTTIPLAGAATLARSPEEAAILAALQASNRWSG